jgi:hypothetical protein
MLHLAARIVPVIRKASMGWDDGMGDIGAGGVGAEGGVTPGFWDGRSLGEEPAVSYTSIVVVRIQADIGEYESYYCCFIV